MPRQAAGRSPSTRMADLQAGSRSNTEQLRAIVHASKALIQDFNGVGHGAALSRRISPEVCILLLPSSKTEGAGKTGCLLHPRSRVRFAQTKLHTSIQGSGNTPAFPAQWLYGLLRALPGERLFCLRRRRETSRKLSASTATPEPHDFAVRVRRVRLSRPQRPPHLTARS